jgi:hypothetical protein
LASIARGRKPAADPQAAPSAATLEAGTTLSAECQEKRVISAKPTWPWHPPELDFPIPNLNSDLHDP